MDPCDQEHHDRPWHHHHWPSDRQQNRGHQWQDHCSRGCSVHQEQSHDGSSPCHLRVIRRRCGLGSCSPHYHHHVFAPVVSRLHRLCRSIGTRRPPGNQGPFLWSVIPACESSFPRRRESIPLPASLRKACRTSEKRLAHIVHHRWWKKYL